MGIISDIINGTKAKSTPVPDSSPIPTDSLGTLKTPINPVTPTKAGVRSKILQNIAKAKQQEAFANSKVGKVVNFYGATPGTVEKLGQFVPRALVSAAISADRALPKPLQAPVVQNKNYVTPPQYGIISGILGKAPIYSIKGRGQGLNEQIANTLAPAGSPAAAKVANLQATPRTLEQKLVEDNNPDILKAKIANELRNPSSPTSKVLAPLFGAGIEAFDLWPGSASEKSAVNTIAKSQDANLIRQGIIQLGVPAEKAGALSEHLAQTSDKKEITQILRDNIAKPTPSTSAVVAPKEITAGAAPVTQSADETALRIQNANSGVNIPETINQGVPASNFYNDQAKGILSEKYAQGRIDDVAQNLDRYQAGLGDKLRAEVKAGQVTEAEIKQKGLDILKENTATPAEVITPNVAAPAEHAIAETGAGAAQTPVETPPAAPGIVSKALTTKPSLFQSIIDQGQNFQTPEAFNNAVIATVENTKLEPTASDLSKNDYTLKPVNTSSLPIKEIASPEEQAAVNKIKSSIQAGTKVPPVVIDQSGKLIEGQLRAEAYRQLGIREIPALEVTGEGTGKIQNISEFFNATGNKKLLAAAEAKAAHLGNPNPATVPKQAPKIQVTMGDIQLPVALQERQMTLELEREALLDNPARALEKYANKRTGELPEVTGKGPGIFSKQGDDIAAHQLGFPDSETARQAYQDYKKKQAVFRREDARLKQEIKDFRSKSADKMAMEKLAGSDKHKADVRVEIAKAQKAHDTRLAERKAAMDEGMRRAEEANRKSALKKEAVYQARSTPVQKRGLIRKIRELLRPAKYFDPTTQAIFMDWERGLLKARALANAEVGKLADIPAKEGLDTMIKYEKGVSTPYNKEIKKQFDILYEEAQARGLYTNYLPHYIPHVYAETPQEINKRVMKYLTDQGITPEKAVAYMQGKKLDDSTARRLSLKPFFVKERTFPTYEVAMKYGLTPKFTHPDQLLAYSREQMERTLKNTDLIENLAEKGKILPVETAPNTWKAIDLPFSVKGYYAEPHLARTLNGIFTDPNHASFIEDFFRGGAVVSRRLLEISLSGGIPNTPDNFFTWGQVIKDTTGARPQTVIALSRSHLNAPSIRFLRKNQKYLVMMAEDGIKITSIADYQHAYENLAAHKNSNFIKKWWDIAGQTFDKAFNEKTFQSFMPQMQVQTYKAVYEKSLAKGLSEIQARDAAREITMAFYGLSENMGRSPFVENVLSTIFFAPKFREGVINTLFRTAKSITTEIRNPFFTKNRKLFAGMVLTYLVYNYLNKKLNGHAMWNNPPNREFSLQIPSKNGTITYVEMMPSFLAFARNMGEGVLEAGRGNIASAEQKFGSIFSMPVKIATEVLANQDYFGNPIYKDTDPGSMKLKKIATYIGLQANHPYVQEVYNQATAKKPLYQSLVAAFEIPLKFSTQDKVAQNEYYSMLDQQAKVRAKAITKVQPLYDKIKAAYDSGDAAGGAAMIDALTPDQYTIYQEIVTAQKSKATKQGEANMYATIKHLKDLIANGQGDEANKIIDGMSASDYKIYENLVNQQKKSDAQSAVATDTAPQIPQDKPVDENSIIHDITTYAKAIGTDPVTAFNRIFTGQHIRRVDSGAIIVERMSLQDSTAVKKAGGGDNAGMKLDHTIPLELGGSNDESNLHLVPTDVWASYTPVENYLGKELRAGKITKKEAQDTITQFKAGALQASDIIK